MECIILNVRLYCDGERAKDVVHGDQNGLRLYNTLCGNNAAPPPFSFNAPTSSARLHMVIYIQSLVIQTGVKFLIISNAQLCMPCTSSRMNASEIIEAI